MLLKANYTFLFLLIFKCVLKIKGNYFPLSKVFLIKKWKQSISDSI
jgi:hypothetical protein